MTDYPDHQSLISTLKNFQTRPQLLAATAYQTHQPYLTELFTTPKIFPASHSEPSLRDFLRIAHWNIEKGKHLTDIIKTFQQHPILQAADLISINEADIGMNRSAHVNVARSLGEALDMHVAFAPCYLEFSKGYGDDLLLPGENTVALQGNAILSRYKIKNPRIIQLPLCYDHFEHIEKRIGNRNALAVDIAVNGQKLCFVSTHLEVRNAPACRAKQISAILSALNHSTTTVIAGDFNSNTFARGGLLTTLRGFARLMFSEPGELRREIAAPQQREPLFEKLHEEGFSEEGFNTKNVTCYVPMKILEDSSQLPRLLKAAIDHQIARYEGQLDFRLDWILGRGVTALSDGEIVDHSSGIVSRGSQTISGLRNQQGGQITDHDPITADVKIMLRA